LLGDEVIHHAQEACGQEEADRIVAIPPLDHGVLHTGIGRVRLESAHGQRSAVDQVQQSHGNDECAKEPVGHINVTHLARAHCAKEDHSKRHPDQRDENVNGPFEFGIFFALGVAQWQGNGCQHDHQLPAPKGESGQFVVEQADIAGALHHVISRCEQTTSAKRKNHRIRMQWAQAAVTEPWNTQIQLGPGQLSRNDHANQHAHHTPNHRHDGELPHNGVVVRSRLHIGKFHFHLFFFKNFASSLPWCIP
jgi:23S rRNA (cytosine1962-C5)-methyltransferase